MINIYIRRTCRQHFVRCWKDEFQITQSLKLADHVLQYTRKAIGKHRFIYMSKIRMEEMLTYYRVLVYDCDKFILSIDATKKKNVPLENMEALCGRK